MAEGLCFPYMQRPVVSSGYCGVTPHIDGSMRHMLYPRRRWDHLTTRTVMTDEEWWRMPDNGKRYEWVRGGLNEDVAAGMRLVRWL